MKKILSLSVLMVFLVIIATFTGCVDNNNTKVDGSLINEITDQAIYIQFVNDVTGEQWYIGIGANKSESYALKIGQYTITARYSSHSDFSDEFIDSTDLNVQAGDDTYVIRVRASTITAWAD